ncbi:MAG: hypothetical protein Kow002_12100 [Anaerolineales bacterium]
MKPSKTLLYIFLVTLVLLGCSQATDITQYPAPTFSAMPQEVEHTPTAIVTTPTVVPTKTPIPISFSEGAEQGLIEEIKRFGLGAISESEYSPDGKLIAYGTAFGVYFFDPVKNEVTNYIPSTAEIGGINFSPEGNWIAYGTGLGEIIVWDITDEKEIIKLPEYTAKVNHVIFSPDQQFLIASDQNGRLKVFQTSDWALVRTHELGFIYNKEFLPDGSKLFVSTHRKGVVTLDSRGWGILNQYSLVKIDGRNTQLIAEDIAISPDGKYMAIAMEHVGTIPVIELATGKTHQLISAGPIKSNSFSVNLYAVDISSDGKYLVFAGSDRTGLVDLANEGEIIQFLDKGSKPRKIAFSPDNDRILFSYTESDLNFQYSASIYNAKKMTNDLLVSINPDDGRKYLKEEKLFPSGNWYFTVDSEKGTITLTNKKTNTPLFTVEAHTPMPFSAFGQTAYLAKIVAATSADETFFITGGADKHLKLWQVAENPDPRSLGTLSNRPEELAISSDSKWVAVRDAGGKIYLFRTTEEKTPIMLGTFNQVHKISFAPDSTLLAASVNKKHIIVWNLAGDTPIKAFETDQSERFDKVSFVIEELVFSPDSKVLISGYLGAPINVWSTTDGKLLAVLDNRTWVTQFQFSEDGTILYVNGQTDVRWWGVKQ